MSWSQITERDLQILERCNQDNIKALEEIVGFDRKGVVIHEVCSKTEQELRSAADLWSEHILEVSITNCYDPLIFPMLMQLL